MNTVGFRRLTFVFLLLFLSWNFAYAQIQNSDLGINPSSLYIGDRENISVTSGNLNIQLPLVHISERGGAGYDFTLSYNSNFWIYSEHTSGNQVIGSIEAVGNYINNHINAVGWTSIDTPFVSFNGSATPICNGCAIQCNQGYYALFPDGRYVTFPNVRTDCYTLEANGQLNSDPSANVYTETDYTSGAHLDAQANTVRMIDGSLLRGTGIDTVFEDRNGNQRTSPLSDSGPNKTQTITYQDDTGPQSLIFTYAPTPNSGQPLSFPCSQVTNANPPTSVPNSAGTELQSVTLPNHTQYTFAYDAYGDIIKLTYPEGGYTRYSYQSLCPFNITTARPDAAGYYNNAGSRYVTAKFTCSDPHGSCSSSQEVETDYDWKWITSGKSLSSSVAITEAKNTSNQRTTTVSLSEADASGKPLVTDFGFPSSTVITAGGKTLQSVIMSYPNDSSGKTQKKIVTTTDNLPAHSVTTSFDDSFAGIYAPSEILTTDFNGNTLKDVKWMYWQNSFNYRLQPLTEQTSAGSSSSALKTVTYGIDETTYMLQNEPAASKHDLLEGASYLTRGNVTSISSAAPGMTTSTTRMQYDILGNVVAMYDALGNKTQYSFTDQFHSATDCAPASGTQSNQFPTTITDALGHMARMTYYSCSGLLQSTQDPNEAAVGKQTSYSYDEMRNPSAVVYSDGESISYNYGGYSQPLTVTTTQSALPDPSIIRSTVYDGFKRNIHASLGEGTTDTSYDSLGRVLGVSNPHLVSPTGTDGITVFSYDALGRKVLQVQPDGAVVQWCYDGVATMAQAKCSANASFFTNDSWVDVTDENGNHRQLVSDALERLSAAIEPDPVSNALLLETDYNYDALGNLLQVDQWGGPKGTAGELQRIFAYDGLSRLLTAKNPESGTVCYGTGSPCIGGYDRNGNLLSKTDARGVVTTYAYDALDRLKSKHYSDNTPTAYYSYDVNSEDPGYPDYPVGRLTDAWTSLNPASLASNGGVDPEAVTEYLSLWDLRGRPLTKFDGIGVGLYGVPGGINNNAAYNEGMLFSYNLAGNLTQTQEYQNNGDSPSILIDYTYDAANRLSSVTVDPATVGLSATLPTTLFEAKAYSAVGLTAANLSVKTQGGQPAITLSQTFDKRLRSTSLSYLTGSGAVSGSGVTLYAFGSPSPLTFDNVGNLKTFSDEVLSNGTVSYDHLNRLSNALATSGPCDGQNITWAYSAFGNRYSEKFSGNTGCTVPVSPVLTFNTKSQITNNGYLYDLSGNVLSDGVNSYAYDAEDRMCAYHNGLTNAYGVYVYDANGTRVEKGTITPSTTLVTSALCNVNANNYTITSTYEFDPAGKIIQEYANGTWQNFNVVADGNILASYYGSGLDFEMNDWVETKRAQISSDGNAANLLYFGSLAFGDGYTTIGTTPNANDLQFTGKEQDAETNNIIDFGPRYYKPSTGRFMSPDYSESGADPDPVPYADFTNPQSLNLYSYAYNNPLTNTDADGHLPCGGSATINITVTPNGSSESQTPDCDSTPSFDFGPMIQFAQSTANVASQAVHQVANIMTSPGGPGCLAGLTGSGAGAGAAVGGEVGLVGLAGGGVGVLATEPAGLVAGGIGGGAAGFAAGMSVCPGGAAFSSNGGGGGGGLSPSAKSKLGNLASRAGEKVRDVIRSRGGSGANVQRVGPWADRTLGEAAEAAARGDATAETAVKVAKQAGRLGQQY